MSAAGWFYVQDDKRLGPVAVEHIVHLVMTTALPASALVWHHGLPEWTEANRVPDEPRSGLSFCDVSTIVATQALPEVNKVQAFSSAIPRWISNSR